MNDSPFVCGFETLGDLHRDSERIIERKRTATQSSGEILAVDELHHERERSGRPRRSIVELDHAVDLRDA
jgi:hypothetical protein